MAMPAWLSKIFHPRVKVHSQAQYHPAVFYPVGALNMVYEPPAPQVARMTPVVWFTGNAIPSGNPPSPWQLPQVYAPRAIFVAGVGGPLSGQIVTGPLNVPDSTDGTQ